MNDGTQDRVAVSFPATPTFSRIGRVTVSGLGLRLGINVAEVEKLRTTVDLAIERLQGHGRIHLEAYWEPQRLVFRVTNPDCPLSAESQTELKESLSSLLDDVRIDHTDVTITLHS